MYVNDDDIKHFASHYLETNSHARNFFHNSQCPHYEASHYALCLDSVAVHWAMMRYYSEGSSRTEDQAHWTL